MITLFPFVMLRRSPGPWRGPLWAVVAFAVVTAACTPTHNWRQVGHEGVPLQALMPCKPERAEREVPLLDPEGGGQSLAMLGCEAGGATFALAALRLPEGGTLTPDEAMARWARASWTTLRQPVPPGADAPAGWARVPVTVPGAEAVLAWRGPGQDHRQRPLQVDLLWTVQGSWMVQAAVYAERPSADAVTTYFDSLRWGR